MLLLTQHCNPESNFLALTNIGHYSNGSQLDWFDVGILVVLHQQGCKLWDVVACNQRCQY